MGSLPAWHRLRRQFLAQNRGQKLAAQAVPVVGTVAAAAIPKRRCCSAAEIWGLGVAEGQFTGAIPFYKYGAVHLGHRPEPAGNPAMGRGGAGVGAPPIGTDGEVGLSLRGICLAGAGQSGFGGPSH